MIYIDSAVLNFTERMCRRFQTWTGFAILTEALTILTTVVLYVLAWDPLPPCAGDVREWLRGWGA